MFNLNFCVSSGSSNTKGPFLTKLVSLLAFLILYGFCFFKVMDSTFDNIENYPFLYKMGDVSKINTFFWCVETIFMKKVRKIKLGISCFAKLKRPNMLHCFGILTVLSPPFLLAYLFSDANIHLQPKSPIN